MSLVGKTSERKALSPATYMYAPKRRVTDPDEMQAKVVSMFSALARM